MSLVPSNPRRRGRGGGRGRGARNFTSFNLPNGSTVSIDSRHIPALNNFLTGVSHNMMTVNPNVPNTTFATQSGYNTRGRRNRFSVNNIPSLNPATNDAQILTKCEKWFDVISGVHKYDFYPGKAGIPQLDRFAGIYENYQLRYLQISYRPSAGTTVPGNLLIGIDYNPNGPDRKAADIALLEPNASGTVFSPTSIRAVINRVMKGKTWLYTAIAGTDDPASKSFCLYVDAQTEASPIGQIWVDYKIAFSTATSGLTSFSPVPLAITSAELVDNIQISPPNDVTFDTSTSNPITINESLNTTNVSTDGTEQVSSFEFDQTVVNKGDEFSVGSMLLSNPETLNKRIRKTPTITFKYSDGTPIDPGSIVPQNSLVKIYTSHYGNILATLFSIVKPLVKPFLATISELIDPPTRNVDEDEPVLLDSEPEKLYNFTFLGDTAVINVPLLNQETIASRLSTNFMLYGGKGVTGSIENFISIYDTQTWSYENNWVYSTNISGSGVNSLFQVYFKNPTDVATFRMGDLIFIHLNILPLDSGFGVSVKTPFACPMDDSLVKSVVDSITANSGLMNEPGLPFPDLKLVNIYTLNNTNLDGSKVNVGLSLAFRFEGANTDTFNYFFFSLPGGLWFQSIRAKDSNISKPETGYALGAGTIQVQFFPTTPVELAPTSSKSEQFELQLIQSSSSVSM